MINAQSILVDINQTDSSNAIIELVVGIDRSSTQ